MGLGSLDCLDNTSSHLVKDGVIINEARDEYKLKLRSSFDQLLSVFLKEIESRGIVRPIPVTLGDKGSIDLFKLMLGVRDRGGFEEVSEKGLWSLVTEELGLDHGLSASVKLICCKYLSEWAKWLRENYIDRRVENEQGNETLGLATELRDLLFDRLLELNSDKDYGNCIDLVENESNFPLTESNEFRMDEEGEKCQNGCYEERSLEDDDEEENICDSTEAEPIASMKNVESRKRKRESLLGMVNWVTQVAKNPDDPSIGMIPGPSMWKDYRGNREFWVQLISIKNALLRRNHIKAISEESPLQNKLKMHPSMYEDDIDNNHRSIERSRCSKRLLTLVKPHLCSCSNSCPATQCKPSNPKTEVEKDQNKKVPSNADSPAPKTTMVSPFEEESVEKEVSVGPEFQAIVPEWNGFVFESDSKWLGTKVWPLEGGKHDFLMEFYLIGQGRRYPCNCQLLGSVECVRFHIAEEKMRLKLELGPVFYRWRFDQMGEVVSLQWSDEEEKRFKDLMRCNLPSQNKCFWDDAFKLFPMKTREDLVSYYFNVVLVRRRAYQNRVTPKDVDSDDDESEFGSFGSFGEEAVRLAGGESNFVVCLVNKQCTDLE